MTDKYRAACVEYVAAKDEIKRLGKAIGAAREDCQTAQAAQYLREHPEKGIFDATSAVKVDHLSLAYEMTADPEGYDFGSMYFVHHDGDVEEYLRGVCLHCLKAHQLVQSRKEARKRFGIAKRRISMLGRAEA